MVLVDSKSNDFNCTVYNTLFDCHWDCSWSSLDNKFVPNKQLELLQVNYDMLIANIVSSNSFEQINCISIDARTDDEVARTLKQLTFLWIYSFPVVVELWSSVDHRDDENDCIRKIEHVVININIKVLIS